MKEEFKRLLDEIHAQGVIHVDLAEDATVEDLKELLDIVKKLKMGVCG